MAWPKKKDSWKRKAGDPPPSVPGWKRRMIAKAEAAKEEERNKTLHLRVADACDGVANRLTVELLKHQKLALVWMLEREASTRGGILADDQGLGKTVTTIALLLKAGVRNPERRPGGGGTLVVCPLSVLSQWEREIATKVSKDSQLSTLIYHDSAKKGMTAEKLASYDVVITTYALVGREIPYKAFQISEDDYGMEMEKYALPALTKRLATSSKLPTGPLGQVSWHRVVLDEAQAIRNASTQVSISCRNLISTYRWGLSGTPLQNHMKELFPYFRFLRYKQLQFAKNFSPHYSSYLQSGKSSILKAALDELTLRRTKSTLIDGEPVLRLPPRIVNRVEVTFGEREAALYERLRARYEAVVEKYLRDDSLKKHKSELLVMLLRLRQLCDHPKLLSTLKANDDIFEADVDEEEGDDDHQKVFEDVDEKRRAQQAEALKRYQEFSEEIQGMKSSKLEAAMEVLRLTPSDEKTLVFSQWTGMLDLFEPELEAAGMRFSRVDGSMNLSKRESQLTKFREDPEVRVMLLSLKAAGCGLNLTAATRVLLYDMWWNPSVEEQAIDRTHRIGQTRPVQVTKFILKDTAEDTISKIQQIKRDLVEYALGDQPGEEKKLTMNQIISMFQA